MEVTYALLNLVTLANSYKHLCNYIQEKQLLKFVVLF